MLTFRAKPSGGQNKPARTTKSNFASCFWKLAYWTRAISDPAQAATTFLRTPPNATGVDTKKLQKEVAEDLAMKRDKKTKGKTNGRPIVLS
jgi:hypothetical protein